ncbi:MAG: pitrilysin family protein [bacterium]|nr:pitrilysin family protein [bacterium]
MFKKISLPNNLRVITIPMSGVTTATILVMVNTGSNNETKEKNGISHFLEHMFFKGTQRRPTAQIITSEVDTMGGYTNAFTSHEYTGYYLKIPHGKFDQALDLISDIYTNSLIAKEEVEKERGAIMQELRMYRDNPQRYIFDVYEDLLYGDQPAGWDVIGTPETLKNMHADDLRDYFLHQYTVENTFVVVSGNIDAESAIKKVQDAFGGIRSGNPKLRPDVKEAQQSPASFVSYKDTDQTHLVLGVRAFGVNADNKRVPASVLAHILGGSMASRLFQEIREKRGLAYAVHSSFDPGTTYGSFFTYTGVDHENSEKVIPLILEEYRKIREEKVTQDELDRTKESMKGRLALSLEGSDSLAFYVGGEEVLTGTPMTPEEVYGKIDRVTAEEVLAVAKEIFTPERLSLAVIGPYKDKQKFDPFLKI